MLRLNGPVFSIYLRKTTCRGGSLDFLYQTSKGRINDVNKSLHIEELGWGSRFST